MIFFSSDLHFFHKRVIEYCNRPFKDLHEMHEKLIENWNSVVGNEDRVVILGDFFFGGVTKIKSITRLLNGKKILMCGNHDDKCNRAVRAQELGYTAVIENHWIEFPFDGKTFTVSHYPYKGTGDTTEEERYEERRPIDNGGWLLHGHVHNLWKVKGKQINVGCDVWDYKPVSELEIIKIMSGAK